MCSIRRLAILKIISTTLFVIPVPVRLLVSVPGGLSVVSVILVSSPVAPWPGLVPRLPAAVRIPLSVSVPVPITLIRRLAVSDAGVSILVAGPSPLVKIVLKIFLISEKMVDNLIALKYLDTWLQPMFHLLGLDT